MSGGSDSDDKSGERFADLIGETKDIARGPARVKTPLQKPGALRNKGNRSDASDNSDQATTSAFRFPETGEPGLGAAGGVSDAQLLALRRADPEPEERIDLHGLRREAAGRLVANRIESARARGLRCVVLIHGRGRRSETGESVLRESVPGWLSKAPCATHVLAFAPAPKRLGGEGATLVLLRRAD
jgi:DNA-nicking Smr family endonuclease